MSDLKEKEVETISKKEERRRKKVDKYFKKKNSPSLFKDFKAFISRGNIVDLSIGVIIGAAFGAIVTALTNGIIMPLINTIIFACTGGKGINLITIINGQPQFLEDGVTTNPKCIYIDWGNFIQVIINFLIIAAVLFIIVKAISSVNGKVKNSEAAAQEDYYTRHPEERPVPAPAKPTQEELLAEIRDLLKAQNEKRN